MAKGVLVLVDGEVTPVVLSGVDMVLLLRTLKEAWYRGYIKAVGMDGGMMTLLYDGLQPAYCMVGRGVAIGYMERVTASIAMDAMMGACLFDGMRWVDSDDYGPGWCDWGWEDASAWDNYLAEFRDAGWNAKARGSYYRRGENPNLYFSHNSGNGWKMNRPAQYRVKEV